MSDTGLIHAKLEKAREELLDLSLRNRLISTSRRSTRSGRLEIVDELSEEVFRHLVVEQKSMSFLPARQAENAENGEDSEAGLLFQPEEEDELDESGLPVRHTDDRLQTRLSSERLQAKLLKLFYDARTYEEEQGVNILYLALGFLKWYEDERSDRERFAPLLLVPVLLERKSAGTRFKIRYADEEITTNLSLQAKLKADFGIALPDVPDVEELSPTEYFTAVEEAVSGRPRWGVLPNDIVLWFFSFAKFLMYRDLQPENWPEERQIEKHPLIRALLDDGFRRDPPLVDDGEKIDDRLEPLDMVHVMDADSSQTVAIEEVKHGRNLVIQGPPGTGKSQTITNLIAAAVKEGKRVLFVAEKMAALQVVKRRLDHIDLGDLCLELHSHKASKRAVLDQLDRTLKLGRPKVGDVDRQAQELKTYRDKLNRHAEILHSHLAPAQVNPFHVLAELVRLRSAGVGPAEFQLDDPTTWTRTDFREKQNMLSDLAVHMAEIGDPQRHPWRGIRLESPPLPMGIARIKGSLETILPKLDRLQQAAQCLADLLRCEAAETGSDCAGLARLAGHLLQAPSMDKAALADEVWDERRGDIEALLRQGETWSPCRDRLSGVAAEVAWSTDVVEARRELAASGRSLFRFLWPGYWRAQRLLRGILEVPPPKQLEDRLDILDTLIKGQKALRALESDRTQELGRRAFGSAWQSTDSDWAALAAVERWERECRDAELPRHFRQLVGELEDCDSLRELLEVVGSWKSALVHVRDLFKELKFRPQSVFGQSDLRAIPLKDLQEHLETWQAAPESLSKWIAYFIRWRKLASAGMGELGSRLNEGLTAADEALEQFQMAYYEELMREAFRRYPELAEFEGVSHERLLQRFRELDEERIQLARGEVALAHFQGLPLHGGDVGEVGIVRRESKKKRKHRPIRRLLAEAGHAVQAIKPVFMISPISVAQYLEPGVLEFDLLLIDEASQVRPVDALVATARARQIVVVGDDQQLPPTRFFDKLVTDDATDDDGDGRVGDLQSILGLCESQNMPDRMLQWHYRSRHHSLIAVSNREFYEDRLYVVPSPLNGDGSLGLRFRHVPEGVFDRGGSATNRVEAQTVAEVVMEHARTQPDKTLGVGAFSVAQRDAILNEL